MLPHENRVRDNVMNALKELYRWGTPLVAAVATILVFASGCNTSDLGPSSSSSDDQTQSTKQELGESTRAYSFDGAGSGLLPSYHERLAIHLLNRMRMDPKKFDLKYPMMHPRAGEFIDPEPPMITSPGIIEAGRWQGQHALTMNCLCPQNPMAGMKMKNSCCDMARKNGKVQCVSPRVDCDHMLATEEQERWKLLAKGTAAVTNEFYVNQQLNPDMAVPAFPGDLLAAQMAGNALYFIGPAIDAFGVAQVTKRVTPEDCLPPMDPCQVGTCTNLATGSNTCDKDNNPSCTGVCKGGSCGGVCKAKDPETGKKKPVSCTLPEKPDPEECKPSKYPKGYYISYLQGSASEPVPTLLDGLHMKLGYTQTQQGALKTFGTTPQGKIGFQIHYYEPIGKAKDAKVVVGGTCNNLQITKMNVTGGMSGGNGDAGMSPDTSGPMMDVTLGDIGASTDTSTATSDTAGSTDSGPMISSDTSSIGSSDTTSDTSGGTSKVLGLRYGTALNLQPGCHRYVFAFTDADGFVHTYPEYGSLGAKIVRQSGMGGNTLLRPAVNDKNCPIWSPQRPSTSCLPKADQCIDGKTRSCYTGRANTRGKGICKLGTETCKNGRWSGVCKGQVTPESKEKCDDGKDNDCNGYVDEGCDDGKDAGGGSDDTGPSMQDAGPTGDGGGTSGDATGAPDGSATSDGGTGDGGSASTDGGGGDITIIVDDDDEKDSGCGCTTSDDGMPPAAPALLLFTFGVVGLRRRRN